MSAGSVSARGIGRRALIVSIEEDQVRRGVLTPAATGA
jgi:hypothetical protein